MRASQVKQYNVGMGKELKKKNMEKYHADKNAQKVHMKNIGM